MNWNVLLAIFKRNFISYFSNPTGYVFICVFVALSSLAAFWPNEFFNANLANLDQLNRFFPAIMLVFIPAITMSMWAEEKRQGTDELLLTLPASDLEVVLGKYLASLSIFSAALLFSLVSNLMVLEALGSPDWGLFFGTYVGYWMVGMMMLAVGMVASFLTSNLTVAFILGAMFNAPLVLAVYAETIFDNPETAQAVRQWSIAERFRDFERGVISLSSIAYFVLIAAVMLYVAMVLIGRRHWIGGRDGKSMFGHYLVRAVSLLVAVAGVSYVFAHHDVVRVDVTAEQLSSLSPQTRKLIKELKSEYPVVINAFISPVVPPDYVQTRLNLISVLDELAAIGGDKVQIHKHNAQKFTETAKLAEETYGILPRTVLSRNRGTISQEDIFLGVALSCGLEKEVLPFIDRGLPPEYELVRSICIVAQEKRKKIGVLKTDAPLFADISPGMMGMPPSMTEDQQLIIELRKQYEVVQVDPAKEIETDQYAMLLAVQPSSLGPPEMENFIAAVRKGMPTAVFEDPLPRFWQGVPGTDQPRRAQQNMFMGPQPPPVKGKITELWDLLGVDLVGDEIISQDWNPYPKIGFIDKEFVFIGKGSGNPKPFSEEDAITSGMQQVLFLFTGSFSKQNKSKLDFVSLCTTGEQTYTLNLKKFMEAAEKAAEERRPETVSISDFRFPSGGQKYITAAHVKGKVKARGPVRFQGVGEHAPAGSRAADLVSRFAGLEGELCADEKGGPSLLDQLKAAAGSAMGGAAPGAAEEDDNKLSTVDVVLVADIDCLISDLFSMRARGSGEDEADSIDWQMQNVAFILNVVDALAGDDRFLEIRKRQSQHRILETIEQRTEDARKAAAEQRDQFRKDFEKARDDAQKQFDESLAKVRKRTDLDELKKAQQINQLQQHGERKLAVDLAEQQQKRETKLKQIQQDLELEVRKEQDNYKLKAVLLPPLPPLLIAFFVYFHRRSQEREGVSKSRLR